MATKVLFSNSIKIMGEEKSIFNKIDWRHEPASPEFPKSFPIIPQFENNNKYSSLSIIVPEERDNIPAKDSTHYFHDLNETSGKLGEIYKDERDMYPSATRPHWDGLVSLSSNDFLRIQDLELNVGSHHKHSVLKELSFQDLGVHLIFRNLDGVGTFRHYVPFPPPSTYNSYVGADGKLNGDDRYMLGLKQQFVYIVKVSEKIFSFAIETSIVLTYHGNDFEPFGVIDAVKFFPQIQYVTTIANTADHALYYDIDLPKIAAGGVPFTKLIDITNDLPNDIKIDSCRIYTLNGRVKMTANNNSSHDVDLRLDSSGNLINFNYLKSLREDNIAIPSQLEMIFDESLKYSNLPSFFVDSNSSNDDKRRKLPLYHVFSAIPPTWAFIFDYKKTNLNRETEIQGTYGYKDKYSDQDYKLSIRYAEFRYPPDNNENNYLYIVKVPRQGEYDNIHFHGYMGHYEDNNLPVIHAPICGYCCFHLHWRWSKLNYDINSLAPLKAFGFASGEATRFNGYNYDGLNGGNDFGAPLIPPNQSLKVAITNSNKVAYDEDNVVNSFAVPEELDKNIKSVWYSAQVMDLQYISGGSYVILEQGAGYAFRYSIEVEDFFNYIKSMINVFLIKMAAENPFNPIYLFLINHIHKLSVGDLFEISYRLMRVYNTGTYADVEQIPEGNYRDAVDEPTMEEI